MGKKGPGRVHRKGMTLPELLEPGSGRSSSRARGATARLGSMPS